MKDLLLATDGSFGAVMACHWAAALASSTDAKVTVVNIAPPHGGFRSASPSRSIARDWISPLINGSIDHDLRQLEGNPSARVLEVSEEIQADLIVMGRRDHHPLAPHLLGAFTHSVLRATPIPAVVVPTPDEQAPAADVLPLAVVGIDGSDGSGEVLRWAVELSLALGLKLEALELGAPEAVDVAVSSPQELRRLAAIIDLESKVRMTADVGFLPDQLVQRSKCSELLIVGIHQRSRIGELLHASMSAYCAAHSTCPVVLVPVKETQLPGRRVR